MAGLDILSTNGGIIVQKSNPYAGNTYSTANSVNGNLAVWLGSKGVKLREIYATDPTLYMTATSIGSLRNVVLQGSNWKNIEVDAASSGVIVSVNTPVKELNAANSNLWYVVQGHTGDNYTTTANVKVLEVSNATTAGKLAPPNINFSIQGLIVPNDTVRNALTPNFVPTTVYNNSARPAITWQSYATTVAAGNTPTFALAPMNNSIRMAKLDKLEEYGEWLRNGPELLAAALRDERGFADISKQMGNAGVSACDMKARERRKQGHLERFLQ